MTAIMCHAANMEDRVDNAADVITQLQRENHVMRELLQLELLNSADGLTGAEAEKPTSSDVAIQTHSLSDSDPFCTGDFATIRPRRSSARSPPSVEHRTADDSTCHSPHQQNPDSDDQCPKLPPSSVSPGNSADISSCRITSSNDICSSPGVSDVDSALCTDEIGNINSSESLETLVNPSDLSENEEYL